MARSWGSVNKRAVFYMYGGTVLWANTYIYLLQITVYIYILKYITTASVWIERTKLTGGMYLMYCSAVAYCIEEIHFLEI